MGSIFKRMGRWVECSMKLDVEPGDIETITADDRGRINLGVDFAEKDVTVAITDVNEPDE